MDIGTGKIEEFFGTGLVSTRTMSSGSMVALGRALLGSLG
jgi:hypothetical protein